MRACRVKQTGIDIPLPIVPATAALTVNDILVPQCTRCPWYGEDCTGCQIEGNIKADDADPPQA